MFVAVDLGTSKTTIVIGERDDYGKLKIAGVGNVPASGLTKGKIDSIQDVVSSLKKAVSEASLEADCNINSCYVGISGNDITSIPSNSMVTLSRDQKVHAADVERAIQAAKNAVQIPDGTEILHTIPLTFTRDNADSVRDPVGMAATRLDAQIQLLCCNGNTLRDIETCFKSCDIELDGIVLNQLAESRILLSEDAKNNGVCLVKIGAGTTEIGVYQRGELHHYECLPIGGNHVTKDMLTVMDAEEAQVEEIKKSQGCAKSSLTLDDEVIRFNSRSQPAEKLEMQRSTLADIVEPRYIEFFHLVNQTLDNHELKNTLYGGGIVLTGGACKIQGATELAREIFRVPVSLSYLTEYKDPRVAGPEYSTIVGLLDYAIADNYKAKAKSTTQTSLIERMIKHLFTKQEL